MAEQLLDLWLKDDSFQTIHAKICQKPRYRAMVAGLDNGARSFFMAALARQSKTPALIVVRDPARAEKLYTELGGYFPDKINLLPPREFFMNTEVLGRSEEYQQMRLQFLEWIDSGETGIYIVTASALFSKMVPFTTWQEHILHLHTGQKLDREKLIDQLIRIGYERSALTEAGGYFSARGDIVDIYPPGQTLPVRIELFDESIESIRIYDPSTQRSITKLSEATIKPAKELITTENVFRRGENKINYELDQALSRLRRRGEKEAAVKLDQEVKRHLQKLAEPGGLDFLGSYYPFFYEKGGALVDYLPSRFLAFIEEPAAVAEAGENFCKEFDDYFNSSLMEQELVGSYEKLVWDSHKLFQRLNCPLISCSLFQGTGGLFQPEQSFQIEAKSAPYYHGQWELFQNDYQGWLDHNYRVFFMAATSSRGTSLIQQLTDQGVFIKRAKKKESGSENTSRVESLPLPLVIQGSLEDGLIIPSLNLALVTEHNLLPQRKKKKRLRSREGIRLSDYRELKLGDFVVHEQHGIGKYQGVSTLEISGVKRDYLLLKYRGTDKLYIPVDQIALIQKYKGGEGPAPRLHSLGGAEWQKLKNKANRAVEELARELLSLYAGREAAAGYRFEPDHPWQQEFETHFPFEETPDQLQAIADVKADLEKPYPMDRLICGDVGYGKTEVAMRAAFKVVMEGKQVAILVPTTVLAQQHYRTFQERFEGFPVRIAQLSRFVSRGEQKTVITDLSAGKIDIIIGTHRLLSGDVNYNDLGLLVLDEEQRFGVRQKEKIRTMRLEVDTLTMTATPIPRTLHLSLSGARDLSVIDTPPENRYPVQTYVLEYSDNLIREAVNRELNRDGQIFIVFNRVSQIDAFAGKIKKMFPGVTVAVGHGRMPETKLERIMADFQAGYYQILVCSTIIESGLDIPNVNTLIVYEADKFGLAQLYQIRGRVGRSNRLAYAYLTYRADKIVNETAQKRLKAVKEFTELGSGFKIALLDLEIRGAGNILGAEQHGFVTAIGFDLYCKLLEKAVAELKGEQPKQAVNPRLELNVNAYIPSSYITSQSQKVDFYQRIYNADSKGELEELDEELTDRYGSPPQPVMNLLSVGRIRILACCLGLELIQQQQQAILIQFSRRNAVDKGLLEKTPFFKAGTVIIQEEKPLRLKLNVTGFGKTNGRADSLSDLKFFLEELTSLQVSPDSSCKS